MLIRECAPLCLAEDPGWGEIDEVRRGPAPDNIMRGALDIVKWTAVAVPAVPVPVPAPVPVPCYAV